MVLVIFSSSLEISHFFFLLTVVIGSFKNSSFNLLARWSLSPKLKVSSLPGGTWQNQ